MAQLFLLRHFLSQWNLENRFAGWTDGPLAKGSEAKAREIAEILNKFKIDKIYSSALFRNQDTIARIFEQIGDKYPFFIHLDKGRMQRWGNYADISENDVPVFVTENLNERYYGKIQGLNKEETIKKYGEEKVHLWRRSYNVAPPGGESEKDVFKRAIPFYKKYVESDLKQGKNILIVASHNALRAVAKYVEKISDKDIVDFEIPYAGLITYKINNSLEVEKKEVF